MERLQLRAHCASIMNSATMLLHHEPKDADLLGLWLHGDRRGGDQLFRRLQPVLHTFFAHKARPADVEDLVQQVWVALGETLRRQALRTLRISVRAYILGVARHVLFRWLREKHRTSLMDPIDSSITQLDPSLSQLVGERLAAQRMKRALQQLPLDTQVLLEFRYLHEMPVPELAVLYEVPEGTIKSRLARARGLLGQFLEKEGV